LKVKIEYIDDDSLSPEEIVGAAKKLYGASATVAVYPDANDSFNLMYHAIQTHITMRQVNSFFDDGVLYPEKLKTLRKEVLTLVDEAFDAVTSDNEDKLR
jgi:hypothetical protein